MITLLPARRGSTVSLLADWRKREAKPDLLSAPPIDATLDRAGDRSAVGRAPLLGRKGNRGVAHAQRFELAKHPAVRGSERRVVSIDDEELNHARRLGKTLGMDHDELSRANVAPHEMLGKRAPTQVGSQKRMLGVGVGPPPRPGRQTPLIWNAAALSSRET